jgi:hypothetical protein
MDHRYTDFNTYLRRRFGCRVQKITLDAGLGCPNRDGTLSSGGCIYCNPRGSGTGAHAQGISISEQMRQGKAFLGRRYKARKFIAYFQSYTNTYAPVETLRRLYDEALAAENVVGLSVGTRPDCVDAGILDLLQGYRDEYLVWIEYGLQSAHDATLAAINRGHDFQAFVRAVADTRRRGIRICAHVILGLPNETRADMLETARRLADLPVDGLKIHLLYVVKGTPLEQLYRQQRYRCLEQDAYVELVCDFLERIPADMVIQRLTGDPHSEELVAPSWALNKRQTLQMIRDRLEERDTWQGRHALGR